MNLPKTTLTALFPKPSIITGIEWFRCRSTVSETGLTILLNQQMSYKFVREWNMCILLILDWKAIPKAKWWSCIWEVLFAACKAGLLSSEKCIFLYSKSMRMASGKIDRATNLRGNRPTSLGDVRLGCNVWSLGQYPTGGRQLLKLGSKYQNPILYTRISSGRSSIRHVQGTPPGFWNGLDWRALVETRPPNIGKLRG